MYIYTLSEQCKTSNYKNMLGLSLKNIQPTKKQEATSKPSQSQAMPSLPCTNKQTKNKT